MGHLGQGHSDGHPLMPQHGVEPSLPPPPRCGGASVASNESHRHPLGQVFTRKMGNLFGGNAWLWWLWWLWSRRGVYDMSLTMCHNSPAPLYGSRVPVDTAPGPVPVYRALKNLPLIPAVKTDSWNFSLRQHSDVHHHRTAPVAPATAQQGRQPPNVRQLGKSR